MAYSPLKNLQIQNREKFSVLEFFNRFKNHLKLTIHTGETSTDSYIVEEGLHRPGLALAGFSDVYSSHQIQIVGHTEWNFLESLPPEKRKLAFQNLRKFHAPMWVVTHGQTPHSELIEMCEDLNVPLFSTPLLTHEFFLETNLILEKFFAPYTKIHGSLVDVNGVGILYIGDSNIGKSECVLSLVERGHRFVADDQVNLVQIGNSLIGMADPTLGHCMEIRGIGIIDIRSMFGIHAVRKSKKIEVIVELSKEDARCDRTGLSNEFENIMGIKVPRIVIPVTPGKNLTVISEVIANNTLMKAAGEDTAKNFNDRLLNIIAQKRSGNTLPDSFLDLELSPYE